MRRILHIVSLGFGLAGLIATPATAGERRLDPGTDLQARIDMAQPGDRLHLTRGEYRGPVKIAKAISLSGDEEARLSGSGAGTVITIEANDVTVTGLTVAGSGSSHEDLDSGIKVIEGVRNARIVANRLEGNLYGIDIHGGIDAIVRGNTIIGRRDHRMNARGNGIYIWNAPGTVVEDNSFQFGRDGIFVNTSRENRFIGNRFADLRFGVHYMYTHDSILRDNDSRNNHAGFAIMYSRDLEISGNTSRNDRDHGIMLNYVNSANISGNSVSGGGDKCLFLYNANKNEITGNRFQSCQIGIHFTAGSERNLISGNVFIDNRTQVKYVGSRWVEWSHENRGNFWSDHAAFDLNADNRADMPYRPNDLMDHVMWTQPSAKLLLGSPAVQLVRWALSAFPSLLPGGVIDSHPLVSPSLDEAVDGKG